MTVTIINDSWRGRGGTFQADGTREYVGTLDVYTNSHTDEASVIRAALTQSTFAAYPTDPWAFLDTIDVRNDEQHPRVWRASLKYTTRPRRKCVDQDVDPLDQPAEISWPTFHEEEIVDKATRIDKANDENEGDEVADQPILNSAGGPFGEPLLRDVTRKGIVIRRNEADYDPQEALEWEMTVNSSSFNVGGKIILPKAARIWEIAGEPQIDGSGGSCRHYWRVTYTIHLRKDGWRRRILDQGFCEIVEQGNEIYRFVAKDAHGMPNAELVPLDGAGRAQDPPYTPAYRVFKTYEERDFSELNLPENADGT